MTGMKKRDEKSGIQARHGITLGRADVESDRSFGQWLKAQRRALTLTQDGLAERVGCAGETIRKIEAGGVRPSRQLAELLASHLDLSAEEQAAFVDLARSGSRPATLAAARAGSRPLPARVTAPPLAAAAPPLNGDSAPRANPYKGLQAFQEADAPDFFGRESLTARLLARLGEATEFARFLAVVGPSGSGKSSVVRAGLLPAIRAGTLPGSARWLVAEIIPGAQPLEEVESV